MKPLLKITRHGVYASLQDGGRFGFRAQGIPVSGPMDRASFEMGNNILNNPANAVCLEMFVGGFEFEALCDHTYVLTGAEGNFTINEIEINGWKSFRLKKGDILSVKNTIKGSILYLIPQGGFTVEPILTSSSTYPLANIGELIAKGSILTGGNVEALPNTRGLMRNFIPQFSTVVNVRIYKGPHFEVFTQESRHRFLDSSFLYTGGNRMGYYFKSDPLFMKEKKEIISEATQFGTIQVPANGQPIILMADAQTVGGYPIIGTVHEEDLGKIAQLRTFSKVSFELMEDNYAT